MLTITEIINDIKRKNSKPDEELLRHLPDRIALIHGRLSDPYQVRDSKESVLQIAALVDLARTDGYKTGLDGAKVKQWLAEIQAGTIRPGILQDGEVIVNCLGLGISGSLPEDKRPDLKVDIDLLKKGKLGSIYTTEGANRLSRDPDRVVSAMLLKLMKETNCKLRTPYEVLSPQIERDHDIIRLEFERGTDELKGMNIRLHQRKVQKAARGEFVGEPIPPGFILPVIGQKFNGQYQFGKMIPYLPHSGVDTQILREFINQGGSKLKTAETLSDVEFPPFPLELAYMERYTALRSCPRTPTGGYQITPPVVMGLATNPKLIGIWHWGEGAPKIGNHEPAVPQELWLDAYELAITRRKPRGKAAGRQPMEFSGLLWDYNHDEPTLIAGNSSAGAYRCQRDYQAGRGRICLDVDCRFIDQPLRSEILRQLDFTPLAEAVMAQLENESLQGKLESVRRTREIADLERKGENLKANLGCGDPIKEKVYWELYRLNEKRLEQLRSRPIIEKTPSAAGITIVKQFLRELPRKWEGYPVAQRNRLWKQLIERVELRHDERSIFMTICWKTGLRHTIVVQRARATDNHGSNWTNEENNLLKMLWRNGSQDALQGALPNRTWSAILNHAHDLGLKRQKTPSSAKTRRRWTPEEDARAKELYETGTPVPDMVTRLCRSRAAVLERAAIKGWQRPASAKWKKAPVVWKSTDHNFKVSKEEPSPRQERGKIILRGLSPLRHPHRVKEMASSLQASRSR
jgi:hypothetical protein